MRAGGDGDLWGGGIRHRQLVPVDKLPGARRNKLHHTTGVAWDLLTKEERRRVGLLPSVVENRGVPVQRSPGKTGEGGHEHRRRWPAKGNNSAACLPTGDDGGGGSD
jgi:hypothetical protein